MDAFKISMQPTPIQAHTPNFCLPAGDATLQPWISGWMLPKSVCNLPPSKYIPHIFVCRQVTQPCNLGYLDGCCQYQYATYLLQSTYPTFLSSGRWHNLATFYFRMDATIFSMQPGADAAYQPSISGWMSTYSVCNLPTLKHTPQFCWPSCWCNLPNFDFRMDALKIIIQPTYFKAHTPNLLSRQLTQRTLPTFYFRIYVHTVCNLLTNLWFLATCNLHPVTCNLKPTTYNLQHTTYNLQPAPQPTTIYFRLDAFEISMQPTYFEVHTQIF